MSKWIAEFELEDGDTMPEHMDLEYKGSKIDFNCRPMWIPVTERLPEYGIAVLTINADDDYEVNHIIDDEHGEWFYDGAIAWAPLPGPYKGGQDDRT